MEYRRGLRNQPRNIEGMFAEQLAWLAGYPNAVAIEIIQQSLRNGWQGLFPPKGGATARAVAPQASVWELKQRLAALDAQIEEVRARGYEDAFGLQLEAEDRRELKRLKARLVRYRHC